MKRFTIKTILLISPILLFFMVMEIVLRQIPNDYNYKKDYLKNHAGEIETLILGSSHSFYGVDPAYMQSNTFNASHVAQSLKYDYKILSKYEHDLKKLNKIILPISYHSYWWSLEESPESWRINNYNIHYDLEANSFDDHFKILSYKFDSNIKRVATYILKGKNEISSTDLGWGTTHQSTDAKDLAETGKTAAMRHSSDIDGEKSREIFSENTSHLKAIVEWAKSKNIDVVLFTPPAFETYRSELNAAQIAVTIQTSEQIAVEFDNCVYMNMLDDTTYVAGDYYDADHLSEIGAKKLSMKLNTLTAHNPTLTADLSESLVGSVTR